jgi:predicted transcriptional regulator
MSDALPLPLLEPTADETRARRRRVGVWQKTAYAAAKRGEITDFDYRVVVALTNYPSAIRGIIWAGVKALADQVGRCERSVHRSIRRLSNVGLLSVRRRGYRSNVYTFMYEGRELFENVISLNQREKTRVNRKPLSDESCKAESCKQSLSNHHHPGVADDNVVRLSDRKPTDDGIQQEASALANEIAVVAGVEPRHPPPSWRGAEIHVAKWLREGWDRETILLAVGSTMATRGSPPHSVRYFEQPIARLVAQLRTSLPSAEAASRCGLDRETEPVPEPALPSDSLGGRWQALKRRLAELHGDDEVKAWFTGVSIVRVQDSLLVLMARTKFIGNWLSQHWADRIVASWLEIGGDKAVTQIRFVRGDENQPQNKFDRDREPK